MDIFLLNRTWLNGHFFVEQNMVNGKFLLNRTWIMGRTLRCLTLIFEIQINNKYGKSLFILIKMPSDRTVAIAALNLLKEHGGNAGLKVIRGQSGTFYKICKIPYKLN